jgi:hypothetical protein
MTLAEQRLNSNHGRLLHAARAVPESRRCEPLPETDWTPRDLLAHVVAWQEEAMRRFREPDVAGPEPDEIDRWNAAAHERLRRLGWDDVLARLEANHRELKTFLVAEPPRWFDACTHRHYTVHLRTLRGALGQSPTTTVVPIGAQS